MVVQYSSFHHIPKQYSLGAPLGPLSTEPPSPTLSIHLESDPDDWPPRFTKLEMDLEGGAKVAFVDARRCERFGGKRGGGAACSASWRWSRPVRCVKTRCPLQFLVYPLVQ